MRTLWRAMFRAFLWRGGWWEGGLITVCSSEMGGGTGRRLWIASSRENNRASRIRIIVQARAWRLRRHRKRGGPRLQEHKLSPILVASERQKPYIRHDLSILAHPYSHHRILGSS